MPVEVTKVEVWAGDLEDQPGGLARVLGALAEAGASLDCVIARRQPDKPGSGVVFLTPVKDRKVQNAARSAGLSRAEHIATLRVEGPDKPGLGHQLTAAIADAGINLRGVSAMVMGRKFVAYLGFDSPGDATRAARAIQGVSGRRTAAQR